MEGYDAATYGNRIAAVYDEWAGDLGRAGAADFLERLAAGGRVLELGIGTGTLALELAARGLEVHGVEASEAMVRELRAKSGGGDIPVIVADFSQQLPDGAFALVYAVGDAFMQLRSQDEQIACVRLVSERLAPGGCFVVEAAFGTAWRGERSRVVVQRIDVDGVVLFVSTNDPVAQKVEAAHVHLAKDGTAVYPLRIRYASPAELDLMAKMVGLRLRERWADWRRSPLAAESRRQISVYEH
jgi:SAM-dependent methyltransferase